VFRFGESDAQSSLALNQLHLHLLQLFSQHARLLHPLKGGCLPIHVRSRSCAPALSQPLPQTPLVLSLLLVLPPPPLLLRAPLR